MSVNNEKAFDGVPMIEMEWAKKKKGLPEGIVRAMMSLYHRAKTRVRVGSELFDKFLVQYVKDLCFCQCFLQLQ